jgi:hypothetical protein
MVDGIMTTYRQPRALGPWVCFLRWSLLCVTALSLNGLALGVEIPESDLVSDDSASDTNVYAEGWAENVNAAVFETLEGGVQWVDGLFVDKDKPRRRKLRNSEFSTKLHIRVAEEGGPTVDVEPDATADLYLPNLNRKLKLLVRSSDVDELPGVDPTTEDNAWLVGVGGSLTRKRHAYVTWSTGLKLNPVPEPYTSIRARRQLAVAPWYVLPSQKVFWRGDDGFGELTSLTVGRELGTHMGTISTSAAKWTEVSDGVEWEQSLSLLHFPGGYTRRKQRRQHYVGVKGSVFGHKTGSGVVDLYRAQLTWRYPLRKKWLYLDIIPGLDFENEDDWDEVPWIRFGLEMYFDGSAGRRAARREA